MISLLNPITGFDGDKSISKCLAKLYVINFKATNPPDPVCPLWKIPAPAIGTGGFGTIGWISRNGIVVCPASFPRSVGAKCKNWFDRESGTALDSKRIGMSGFSNLSSVLEKREQRKKKTKKTKDEKKKFSHFSKNFSCQIKNKRILFRIFFEKFLFVKWKQKGKIIPFFFHNFSREMRTKKFFFYFCSLTKWGKKEKKNCSLYLLPTTGMCSLKPSFASVLSFAYQRLFSFIKIPVVKLNGVARISRFKFEPSNLNFKPRNKIRKLFFWK